MQVAYSFQRNAIYTVEYRFNINIEYFLSMIRRYENENRPKNMFQVLEISKTSKYSELYLLFFSWQNGNFKMAVFLLSVLNISDFLL